MGVHWQLNLIGSVIIAVISYGFYRVMINNGSSQAASIGLAVGFAVVAYPFIVALSTKGRF